MTTSNEPASCDDSVRKFLEHALHVFESDDPADTHVVLKPELIDTISTYMELNMHADKSAYNAGMLPQQLIGYAETFDGNRLKFSDLCLLGVLADRVHFAGTTGAAPQLCVPKYMIEALFHIVMSPGFAYYARRWFSIQDYEQ